MNTPHSSRVALKGLEYGTQYAGWAPRAAAMTDLGNVVLADQRIPVAEGVTLSADVYTPKEPGRYPAVVSFSAYNFERHTAGVPTGTNEIGSPPVFTDRGYCPVIVERRGMGRSDGRQGMFFSDTDVDDHEKVIAWAADQPWCNGEVVLFGTSYYGMTQPLVAARRPPALKAFFANEICTDFVRHLTQFGGVPNLYFLNIWMGANFTQEQYDLRMSPDKRALISHVTNGPAHAALEKVVHSRVDEMFAKFTTATPVDDVLRIYTKWIFDEKTRQEATVPPGSSPVLDRIDVPFVTVQNLGYFNLHQYGSYELFEKASTPTADKYLILAAPTYELPVYSWQGEALAFFDHILRGTQNGYSDQAHVRSWTDGTDAFVSTTSFPPEESRTRRLYLNGGGDDLQTHTLEDTPPAEGLNTWVAIPMGMPTLGGLDRFATQTLAYELTAEHDLEFSGAVTAQLKFSCNELDSYVLARLCRVDLEGELHHLSLGSIRPVTRDIDETRGSQVEIAIDTEQRAALVPGEAVDLRFSLTPGPFRLRRGEKLRLDIGSRTDLLRKGPGDGYAQFDMPVPPYLSRNTVHYGGRSWIELDQV